MVKPLNRKCERCGKIYVHCGKHKECSLGCRLLNRIKIVNGCWEWQSFICPRTGYGRIRYERKLMTAHRLSYIFHKSEIPKNMLVCHTCDNHKCINPEHLFLGTHADNAKDMVKKARGSSHLGEKNQRALLNEKTVLEVRKMHLDGMKIKDIANKFNIKYFTCLDVINRRNWNHI